MSKRKSNFPNMEIDTLIKRFHYQWCLHNGRDVAWYKEIKNAEKKK